MSGIWRRIKNFLKRFWPLTYDHFDRKIKELNKRGKQQRQNLKKPKKFKEEKIKEIEKLKGEEIKESEEHKEEEIKESEEHKEEEIKESEELKEEEVKKPEKLKEEEIKELEKLKKEEIRKLEWLKKKKHRELQDLKEKVDKLESTIIRPMPRPILSFEFALVEHCDLNCAGCNHFSSLAEPEFADYEEVARDLARLSELTHGRIKRLQLLGGEPLLHPELIKFLKMARENFPDGNISIVTNGVKLLNQPEEFWQACKENKIMIRPTKYPIPLDYEEMEKRAAEHGVEYLYFNDSQVVKTTTLYKMDLKGQQNGVRNFLHCPRANSCIYLQHGRLYTCVTAPTARHFCRYFGVDLKECPEDSIDIYQAGSVREILEFLAKPIPFCRYCLPDETERGLPWHQTKRAIEEWI